MLCGTGGDAVGVFSLTTGSHVHTIYMLEHVVVGGGRAGQRVGAEGPLHGRRAGQVDGQNSGNMQGQENM